MKLAQGVFTRPHFCLIIHSYTKDIMTNSYTLIPNTQVLRSKIDVFEMTDPHDEDINHRVELTIDNDGVYITSCEKNVREVISIGHKDLAIATARCILEAYNVPYTL